MNNIENAIDEIRELLQNAEASGKSGHIKISMENGHIETITEKERQPRKRPPTEKPAPLDPATQKICPICLGYGEDEFGGRDCLACRGKGWVNIKPPM